MPTQREIYATDPLSLQQCISGGAPRARTFPQAGSAGLGDVELLPSPYVCGVGYALAITLYSPRALIASDSLWVGESSQQKGYIAPILRRYENVRGSITMSKQIDLRSELPTAEQIRDLAQDRQFVFAACWDTGQVAIIEKSTSTIIGWGSCGDRVVSVAADGEGHFYALVAIRGGDEDQTRLQRFTTADCLYKLPGVQGPELDVLLEHNQRHVRYGGGWLWLADGGWDQTGVTKVDPATLGVVTNTPLVRNTMDVLYAFGSVWACGQGETNGVMHRLNPETMVVEATIPSPIGISHPIGLCVGPDENGSPYNRVWMSDMQSSNVCSVDPETDTFDETVDLGEGYVSEGIASIGEALFVGAFLATENPSGLFSVKRGVVTLPYRSQLTAWNPT